MCFLRNANLYVAHASIVENFLSAGGVGIAHLHHHARVLCKKRRDEVGTVELVEADVDATLGVGKAHFEQRRSETARGDIVARHDEALVDQLLHSHEGIAEVFGILHRRHIATHLA